MSGGVGGICLKHGVGGVYKFVVLYGSLVGAVGEDCVDAIFLTRDGVAGSR